VAKTLLAGRVHNPNQMESHLVSSETTTESQDTNSSDELTEPVAAVSSPSVSGSPGVRMGMSADAVPVPEVEPEDLEANSSLLMSLPIIERFWRNAHAPCQVTQGRGHKLPHIWNPQPHIAYSLCNFQGLR